MRTAGVEGLRGGSQHHERGSEPQAQGEQERKQGYDAAQHLRPRRHLMQTQEPSQAEALNADDGGGGDAAARHHNHHFTSNSESDTDSNGNGEDAASTDEQADEEARECRHVGRRYVTPEDRARLPHAKPPLLLTLPGSGNTWFRMLLEYGTGFFSSSVYNDFKLKEVMPGELRCDNTTIVVKSHMHLGSYDPEVYNKLFKMQPGELAHGYPCRELRPFDSVIGIIRDPFHAALAEATRQLTGGHASGISRSRFHNMPQSDIARRLVTQCEMWAHYMKEYQRLLRDGFVVARNFILIRFEDMTSPLLKHDTLGRLLRFVLGPDMESPLGPLTKPTLDCIFSLADDVHVHRTHGPDVVSAEEVLTPEIVCKMWAVVRQFAAAFDYRPPFGITCDNAGEPA
ncbi:hypothetical protein PTSG_05694 [Salpingoeca rosetta]|uniref:Sulfotransferase domain-containing protein n=1 Tax=Salpingoeca rosetta (strain ATCC 50818 / BSB-021) TaxID=946362 RepID=F2UAY4_SALR5|nr:uncharacterized protein PTSG_05694 [Salpingoeca rosetta]EGD73997.1 hypothetical protein PTSG_05694 [Salpingoeca rosetta]|eukprot:XP_004993560.1 hypothetical protein PTSG_05694 [Salpingoeca rosetta]